MGIFFGILAMVLMIFSLNTIGQSVWKKDYSQKEELLIAATNAGTSGLIITVNASLFAASLVTLWGVLALVLICFVTSMTQIFQK